MVTIPYAPACVALEVRATDFQASGRLRKSARQSLILMAFAQLYVMHGRMLERAEIVKLEKAVDRLRSEGLVEGRLFFLAAHLAVVQPSSDQEIVPVLGHPREVAILVQPPREVVEPPFPGFAFTDDGEVLPDDHFDFAVALLGGRAISLNQPMSTLVAGFVASGYATDTTGTLDLSMVEKFWVHLHHHVDRRALAAGDNARTAADLDLLQSIVSDEGVLTKASGDNPTYSCFLAATAKLLEEAEQDLPATPGVLAYCRKTDTSIALFEYAGIGDAGWDDMRSAISTLYEEASQEPQGHGSDLATCNVDLTAPDAERFFGKIQPFIESGTLIAKTQGPEGSKAVWDHGDTCYFVSKDEEELWVATWTKDRPMEATVH